MCGQMADSRLAGSSGKPVNYLLCALGGGDDWCGRF